MYSPADDELLDVLGVELDVAPDVPVVPLLLPFCRQPVRVMVPLELWLLDVPLVCAAMATGKATTTNATTHICLFMLCLLLTHTGAMQSGHRTDPSLCVQVG